VTHLSAAKPAGKSIRKQLQKRIDAAVETLRRAHLHDSDIHEARKRSWLGTRIARVDEGLMHHRGGDGDAVCSRHPGCWHHSRKVWS
jgi:hypothetical protein